MVLSPRQSCFNHELRSVYTRLDYMHQRIEQQTLQSAASQESAKVADNRRVQVTKEEDPHLLGLVLEWVYGTIVSTAEKSRDGAKRALGAAPLPSVQCHAVFDRVSGSAWVTSRCSETPESGGC